MILLTVIPSAATSVAKVFAQAAVAERILLESTKFATGSLTELTVVLDKQDVTVDQVNSAMKQASDESFGYTEDEIVSSDVIGVPAGSIFDATQTKVIEGTNGQLVKTVAWYDNEYGFVANMVGTLEHFANIK